MELIRVKTFALDKSYTQLHWALRGDMVYQVRITSTTYAVHARMPDVPGKHRVWRMYKVPHPAPLTGEALRDFVKKELRDKTEPHHSLYWREAFQREEDMISDVIATDIFYRCR